MGWIRITDEFGREIALDNEIRIREGETPPEGYVYRYTTKTSVGRYRTSETTDANGNVSDTKQNFEFLDEFFEVWQKA